MRYLILNICLPPKVVVAHFKHFIGMESKNRRNYEKGNTQKGV